MVKCMEAALVVVPRCVTVVDNAIVLSVICIFGFVMFLFAVMIGVLGCVVRLFKASSGD